MRFIFADTAYWIALTDPRDYLHRTAIETSSSLDQHPALSPPIWCSWRSELPERERLAPPKSSFWLCQRDHRRPDVELVRQTPDLSRDALALYRERLDKRWSLTDCTSFLIMDRRQIVDALTYDQHFEQSGYRPLLRD
jgi:predicted nucleic acid-binding protein